MEQRGPVLYYCYDAYCGWCYGFSSIIMRLFDEYSTKLEMEVLSGGMIPVESAHHIGRIATYIKNSYQQVEELTGAKFGEDYLWHINNPDLSDWYPHSEKAAIAMAVFRDYHPSLTVPFAGQLQKALFQEGRDLTDDEAYRHLLEKYSIPAEEFYAKLHSEEYKDKAYYDFSLCRQLQVTGFPAVFLQTGELKFYLLARGYTDYETLRGRLEAVLNEMDPPAS